MKSSLHIGRIMGIPIRLHFTFIIILAVFAFVFSTRDDELLGFRLSFGTLDASVTIKYLLGTIAAIIFFITVLVHELAHSYMAMKYGVKIKSITLMIFGGVASMEEIPKRPRHELIMAFAGPFSSLVIGFSCYALMLLVGQVEHASTIHEGTYIMLGLIGFYNIFLAGFNLMPAFPMDGGRMLRAALATRMSHLDATKKAAAVGRSFAIAMAIFAILMSVNIFLLIIAIFIYYGAKDEEQATIINDSLEGMSVANLMSSDVKVVHPDTSLQQLLDLMYYTRHEGFPVVDKGLVGMVTLTDTKRISREMFPIARVRDIMVSPAVTIPASASAIDALKRMSEARVERLAVTNESGVLIGVITRKDFLRVVDIAAARRQRTNQGFSPPPGQVPPPPPSPPTASS